ncbi:MAG: hypothetical protein ACOYB8_03555 [Eubacteriaceae bacterium]|jgi:hypothetical protein
MKQRFSAGGSLAVWISSSLDALEKAGFTDIKLTEDNLLSAGRNGIPFDVQFTQKSPGQITLEINGEDDKDINLYKYNVARILQNVQSSPDAEETAQKKILAAIAASKPSAEAELPENGQFRASAETPAAVTQGAKTLRAETTKAEPAAPETTQAAASETAVHQPEAAKPVDRDSLEDLHKEFLRAVTGAEPHRRKPASEAELNLNEASETPAVTSAPDISVPDAAAETTQEQNPAEESVKTDTEESSPASEQADVSNTAAKKTVNLTLRDILNPGAAKSDTEQTAKPETAVPEESEIPAEQENESPVSTETGTQQDEAEKAENQPVSDTSADSGVTAPDFSELQEGVTTPLPIAEILAAESAEQLYSVTHQTAEPEETGEAESVDKQDTNHTEEETNETLSEPEHPQPGVTVYKSPDDADAVIVIGETPEEGNTDTAGTEAPAANDTKEQLLSEENQEYSNLKPIENPTTAGELYNNLLCDTPSQNETDKKEAEKALPAKPWYKQEWFALLMLILLPPIGLILIWHFKTYTDKARKSVTVFFALYTILWVWLIALPFMPARTSSDSSGSVTVTADSVQKPSKQEQVSGYWNNADVQNFMNTIPTDMTDYGTILTDPGITAGSAQILTIMQNITDLDNAVLKISDVGSDNAAYVLQQKINQAAVAYNEAALNMNTALTNNDTALLQTAQDQLTAATAVFQEIATTYSNAVAE